MKRREFIALVGGLGPVSLLDLADIDLPDWLMSALQMWSGYPGATLTASTDFERSAMAMQAAQDAGLETARNIQGGIDAWKRAAGPLVPPHEGRDKMAPVNNF